MKKITSLNELEKHFFISKEMKQFLSVLDSRTECGRYDFGEGGYVNIVSYAKKESIPQEMEVHRKYVDVQYLIDGNEKIWYGLPSEFEILRPYEESAESVIYKAANYKEVCCKTGEAIILYPEDAHTAGLCVNEPQTIKKAVIKISINQIKQ